MRHLRYLVPTLAAAGAALAHEVPEQTDVTLSHRITDAIQDTTGIGMRTIVWILLGVAFVLVAVWAWRFFQKQ